jgi:hypothetical protein
MCLTAGRTLWHIKQVEFDAQSIRAGPARKGIQQSGISDPFGEVKSAYHLKSDLGKK